MKCALSLLATWLIAGASCANNAAMLQMMVHHCAQHRATGSADMDQLPSALRSHLYSCRPPPTTVVTQADEWKPAGGHFPEARRQTKVLHSALCTLHSALSTLHSALCTLHSALSTQHSALCTLHSALCTLHNVLCTLHSALSTVHCALPSRLHSALLCK